MRRLGFYCLLLLAAVGCMHYADGPAARTASTVSVAFPRALAVLPSVAHTYVIGATSREDVTNVMVNGTFVPVHPSGAWATRVAVVPGTNVLTVCDGASTVSRIFRVEAPRPSAPEAAKPPKVYRKLDYSAENPRDGTPRIGVPRSDILVALDPGHGGSTDLGAVSPHGFPEKTFNLKLALALRDELTKRGYRVMMTRADDTAIALFERARPAHEEGADIFVSLHHNAPASDGDAAASRYAAVYSWNDLGAPLAAAIAGRFAARTLKANFVVMRSAEIPSVLIEADFITNPQGEADSWKASVIRMRAIRLADGIDDYFRL